MLIDFSLMSDIFDINFKIGFIADIVALILESRLWILTLTIFTVVMFVLAVASYTIYFKTEF